MTKEIVVAVVPSFYCPECGQQLQYTGLPFREQLARGEFYLDHKHDYSTMRKCSNDKQVFKVTVPIMEAVLVEPT